jgi:hypothetical protein
MHYGCRSRVESRVEKPGLRRGQAAEAPAIRGDPLDVAATVQNDSRVTNGREGDHFAEFSGSSTRSSEVAQVNTLGTVDTHSRDEGIQHSDLTIIKASGGNDVSQLIPMIRC